MLSRCSWMLPLVLVASFLPTSTADRSARAAELLTYRGELRATRDGVADKQFTLHLVTSGAEDRRLFWALAESGTVGWSWVDRIGQLNWDEQGRTSSESGPALRYEDGEISGIVPILLVSTRPAEPWAAGVRWEHEGLQHEVAGPAENGASGAWRVVVRNNFGEKRSILVDEAGGLVIEAQERVFLGQGQKYELQYEIAERQTLDGDAARAAQEQFASLIAVRDALQLVPRQVERRWNDNQLASLRSKLPELADRVTTPGAAEVLRAAIDETREERGRAGALEALRKKAVGMALPDFEFEPVSGKSLARDELNNRITVLHFWDYQDAPLREPYGQVGYLDYLQRKYNEKGVRVIGVVVNQNTERALDTRQAILSARRFAKFMNLSYSLYIDKSTLLRQLGDPRVADAKLPLFVAVGHDGRVLHYSAGNYEVDSNQGLVELENVIKQALQSAP